MLKGLIYSSLSHAIVRDLTHWPTLEIPSVNPAEAFSGFSAHVQDAGQMAALRERLYEIVRRLMQTQAEQLDQAVQQACSELEAMAEHLRQELTRSLAEDFERRRKDLADKMQQIERLKALVQMIDTMGTEEEEFF